MGLKFNPLAPGGFVNIPAGGSLTKEQEEKIAGVPAGGTTGQFLKKKSNTNYDDEWGASAGGPPTGAAGGDLAGEYPNPTIGAEKVLTGSIKLLAITAALLAAEAVTTAKIKLEAITEALLATDAVTAIKIKAEAVEAAKIKAEAVETSKIKLLAVTAATLAAEAVETAKIKNKAVTDEKLAGLSWTNVEAVNAKLEQTVTIQVAVFNGLVFMRGLGKAKEEIAAKAIIFTMPAAARPATERHILITKTFGGTADGLAVRTNGEVEVTSVLAAAATPVFDSLVYSL